MLKGYPLIKSSSSQCVQKYSKNRKSYPQNYTKIPCVYGKIQLMVKPDIQKIQKIQDEEFLGLREASSLYGYTQHHFGLLARQGKLKAQRIGKKWFTKKIWINEYIKTLEDSYRFSENHYSRQENPLNGKPGDFFISHHSKDGRSITESVRSSSNKYRRYLSSGLFHSGRFHFRFGQIASALSFLTVVLLLLQWAGWTSWPNESFLRVQHETAEFVSEIAYEVSLLSLSQRTEKNLVSFWRDTKNAHSSVKEISPETFGSFLSNVSVGVARSFSWEETKKNLYGFADDVVRMLRGFKDYAAGVGRYFKLAFKEEGSVPGNELLGGVPETKQSLVIVPVGYGDMGKEELEAEIKKSFSDEIIVEPDEEGDTGVIRPVFRSSVGDEYLYIMVPVKPPPEAGSGCGENGCE